MTEEEKKAIEILKKWVCDVHSKLCKIGAVGIPDEEWYATETVLNLIKKQESEINKLKKELDITKTNYGILQGEMDRIGIDTLHLEAGSSTDDVIDEINKLNNVIDRMTNIFLKTYRDWEVNRYIFQYHICSKLKNPESEEDDCYADSWDEQSCKECIKEYFMKPEQN